jgi:hypothetical protein
MKRIAVLAFAVAALAVPAAQAHAAANQGPTLAQFKALQKQVKTLQAQVKTLQKFVPTSCSTKTCESVKGLTNLVDAQFGLFICQSAVIADEFQGTWTVIDQISAATQAGKTYFGPQTPIADSGACTSFQITRSSAIPPNVAMFSALIKLVTG